MTLAALLVPLAPRAGGPEDLLAADTVTAKEVAGPLAADPGAAFWSAAPAREVLLAPQRTVRLHDRRANEALDRAAPRRVQVRAATDGADLAVLVEWSDAEEDRAATAEPDAFGDAVALQLPLRFGPGVRLPYVGMGDETLPVALHLQRAGPEGTLAREGTASG